MKLKTKNSTLYISRTSQKVLFLLGFLVCHKVQQTQGITAFGLEGGLSREQPPPRPEQIWDNPLLRPAFDNSTSTNVVASAGRVSYLHCRVNHLGNRVVTWIRERDSHVLTVGLYSYTSDQRFTALHSDGSPDWLLKVTFAQPRDSGIYECQVSTEPKLSKSFNLTIIESTAVIEGSRDVHMSAGNTLNLTCSTSVPGETPAYFYWYHNKDVLKFTGRKEILKDQTKKVISNLVIPNVSPEHSGNYTCAPENASPSTVTVYVLKGEQPAAMQHGESSTAVQRSSYLVLLTVCTFILIEAR